MKKYFYDAIKHIEVVDLAGEKTIEQINTEFNGNFTETTKQQEDNLRP
ncbi:MAG: hypothetical protein PHP10_03595 [Candidatus Omnitrophica bacterium]|nr:hypothetical protein [Candidatus Omnitrophota bacterium]